MLTKGLTIQEALACGRTLPWAWVRCLSRVTLGPAPADIDPEELIEARFFNEKEEIRLFRAGGELRAVRLMEQPEDSVLVKSYRIKNPAFGEYITVRCGLEADEDGQVGIVSTRLAGWRGGEGCE